MYKLIHVWHGWFFAIFLFCAALVFSNVFHWFLFRILRRKQQETHIGFGASLGLNTYLTKPARAIFILTCLFFVQPTLPIPDHYHTSSVKASPSPRSSPSAGSPQASSTSCRIIFLRRYDLTSSDNVQARRVHTQFQLFRRILITFIIVITIGGVLWTFHDDRLWNAGSGLLASAGIASLILASAAKSTASNFLAGLQIAITEPIRIDDVVVVQGDWGRIEEINSSYVVVKIWDLRRLIVPLSYFIENPFENWTRQSADILAYPYIYVDYSLPIPKTARGVRALRPRLTHYGTARASACKPPTSPPHCMELRCLVTCRNSPDQFNFACDLREHMAGFIQQNYPNSFPTTRFAALNNQTPTSAEDPNSKYASLTHA